MPARILDGKALAQQVRQQVAEEVGRLKAEAGVTPGLTVVLVGENPASQVYVRNKRNACNAAGMNGTIERLPADTALGRLIETIDDRAERREIAQRRRDDDRVRRAVRADLDAAFEDLVRRRRRGCTARASLT